MKFMSRRALPLSLTVLLAMGHDAALAQDKARASEVVTAKRAAPELSLIERAKQRSEKGEHHEALSDLTKALELESANPEIHLLIGVEHYYLGEQDKEIAAYDQALRLDANYVAALANRGAAFLDAKKWDAALADYQRALTLEPDRDDILSSIADVHEGAGRLPDAERAHDQAVKIGSKSSDAWRRRAEFLARLGRDRDAIASYGRALKIAPRDVDLLVARAQLLADMDERDAALKDFDAALKAAPDSAHVRNSRGRFFYGTDENYEAALAEFDEAIKLDPKLDAPFHNRGLVFLELGRHDRAIREYNASLALKPSDPITLAAKAAVYVQLEDYLLAKDILDLTVEADPSWPEAFRKRAEVKKKLGDEAGARADEAKAKELEGG